MSSDRFLCWSKKIMFVYLIIATEISALKLLIPMISGWSIFNSNITQLLNIVGAWCMKLEKFIWIPEHVKWDLLSSIHHFEMKLEHGLWIFKRNVWDLLSSIYNFQLISCCWVIKILQILIMKYGDIFLRYFENIHY